ncbi:ABC transporter permease [Mangrovivirga sp. M17]|uniref:ABC transporter permease n=1 Tax=Mangrovivirga halotolerans TaxID=2993936 RepID=A0ABT3RLX4_9BACT|nr:ABC transporter permease [Mangrovivirga halotolerans]MCX2742617.1 ABC transporter permease [Mangrovivirga halotolerans]
MKNYFIISFLRNMKKNKMFSFINIFGLAIGLAFSLMVFAWVHNMYSVDKFHSNIDRIYQVMEHQTYSDGNILTTRATPGVLGPEFEKEVPEVELAARATWDYNMISSTDDNSVRQVIRFTDPNFLKIFSFPVLEGFPSLNEPNEAVITKKAALELFNSVNVVGKTMTLNGSEDYKISAVLDLDKSKSSIDFDVLVPFQPYYDHNQWMHTWGNNNTLCYVLLKENVDYNIVNSKISDFIKKRVEGSVVDLFLYPFKDIFLKGSFRRKVEKGGQIENLKIFIVIAVFLLIIACINFMNLSTAQSVKKAKETGIRKVIGASRISLIRNYLFTTLIYAVLAVVAGLVLVELMLPYFNSISPLEVEVPYDSLIFWIGVVSIVLITTLMSGIYPAIYLSNFKAVSILKGKIEKGKSALRFRQLLVVVQFSLSIILITGTIFTHNQLKYMRNKNIGMDKDRIIFYYPHQSLFKKFDSWKNEIEKLPGIELVTRSDQSPIRVANNTGDPVWEGKNPDDHVIFDVVRVGEDFTETVGIKISKGRSWDGRATDSLGFVINDEAAKLMGMKNPVGEKLSFWGKNGTVIGVFEGVHTGSLRGPIAPTILNYDPLNTWRVLVKFEPFQEEAALASLQSLHSEFDKVGPFEYSFMHDEYDNLYKNEEIVGKLAGVFTIVAIIISCLGLFGLASFSAEQRTKEIGIRKVLGSSVNSIVFSFNASFIKLLIISTIIAVPIIYFILDIWLNDFTYHLPLKASIFILGSISAFLVAIITVSYHALKAAHANPVNALKND